MLKSGCAANWAAKHFLVVVPGFLLGVGKLKPTAVVIAAAAGHSVDILVLLLGQKMAAASGTGPTKAVGLPASNSAGPLHFLCRRWPVIRGAAATGVFGRRRRSAEVWTTAATGAH
jgi:hypothetical protein